MLDRASLLDLPLPARFGPSEGGSRQRFRTFCPEVRTFGLSAPRAPVVE
jgi:hypothetical protein